MLSKAIIFYIFVPNWKQYRVWRKESCPLAARWVISLGDGLCAVFQLCTADTCVWPSTVLLK